MFSAFKEKRFAKRVIKDLLKSHAAIVAENPGLSGKALYREVLLHSQKVDPSRVDQILSRAEDSVDEWTAGGQDELGFRQVVHFFIMSQHGAGGPVGTRVSIREIVYALIPADL